ncbi:TetR/AcrR family transcriptional regulator [Siminovitchia sediminis]|uniref:TetR/AcrR family transcriptional regulator n=1 Tax=Siminovitchia sediminis TaxID=1274353 RepID=A0ABW4KDU6_9BACI
MRCIKERILKEFREEVRQQGLRFSMDDLAARLGVSKKTIYKYYSSKAEILEEMIDQTIENMEEKAAAIIQDEQLTLVEKLKGVMAVAPDHYDLTDVRILNQMKRFFPEQWEKLDHFLQSDWDQIKSLVEQGVEKGYIKDYNVSLMMKVIIASINTTLDQSFYLNNQITTEEALEDIVEILLGGILENN